MLNQVWYADWTNWLNLIELKIFKFEIINYLKHLNRPNPNYVCHSLKCPCCVLMGDEPEGIQMVLKHKYCKCWINKVWYKFRDILQWNPLLKTAAVKNCGIRLHNSGIHWCCCGIRCRSSGFHCFFLYITKTCPWNPLFLCCVILCDPGFRYSDCGIHCCLI